MRHGRVGFFLAAVFALTLCAGVVVSPPAAAEGSIPHGYPQSSWPTVADEARIAEWSAYGQAIMLREMFRSGAGTYQDVCTDTGFLCVAGTGFNVNVSPGICLYNNVTGAVAPIPAFRYLQEIVATEVTDWDANPGANTYYVHVMYNDLTTDGVVVSDPAYTVDTDPALAGTLTVCSIVVAGAEPSSATYTYNDLRVVGNGLHYQPTAAPAYTAADLTATDDLLVGDDGNVADAFTVGVPGAPTATLDGTGGTLDADGTCTCGGLVTAEVGLDVPTVGITLADAVPITFDSLAAVTCVYDLAGTEVDCHGADFDFDGAVEVDDLSVDGATIASTPAEIDEVADLSAAGLLPRTCMITVDTAGERAAGAHEICTLPATAIVLDVYELLQTAEVTNGTKSIDIGPAGTAAGYANDLPATPAGIHRPRATLTTGGTETYFASTTRGTLLATLVAGADVAGDVGTYYEFPDTTSSTLVVSYTIPAGNFNEYVATLVVSYLAGP